MSKTKNKGHLRIAYSAENFEPGVNSTQKVIEDAWDQLDLFDQPDTIVFVSPERYSLSDLVNLLKSFHVTQIIDLRLLPHFSFGGASRNRFIRVLSELHLSYYSLASNNSDSNENNSKGSDLIKRFLDRGPSMVFSDIEPSSDPDISSATSDLTKAGVRFKPVYATLNQ